MKRTPARDAMSSPLDRLQHWHIITEEQANAGREFASAMGDYLTGSDGSETAPARARAFMGALVNVDSGPVTPSTASIVWDVCVSENDRMRDCELQRLRAGLDAISGIVARMERVAA